MLVQVTIENFGCFRDETTISFRALAGVAHPPGQVVEVEGVGPVLRTVAFYGANASGKSTVLKAIAWLTRLMRKGVEVGASAPSPAFKFGEAPARPTRVEVHFVDARGGRWAYSLATYAGQVQDEWLERFRGDEPSLVFERTRGDGEQPVVTWGGGLDLDADRRAFYDFVAQGTRHEQPVLAELRARNAHELRDVHRWGLLSGLESRFWEWARDVGDATHAFALLVAFPEFRAWAARAVGTAGSGVSEFELDTTEEAVRTAWLDQRELAYGEALQTMSAPGNRVRFRVAGGVLDWADLSDGTIRLMEIGMETAYFADCGAHLLDELERSLHPALARWVVRDWQARRDEDGKPFTSQLLFTTHELHLLDETLIGRDGVFFTEKRADGSSVAYPLTDFKREQLDQLAADLPAGYLAGRFGAIPPIPDPAEPSGR